MLSTSSLPKDHPTLSISQTPQLETQQEFSHFLELFDRQISLNQNNLAILDSGQSLDYTSLYEKSLVYSAQLRALGIGLDDIIAVILPRTLDLIPALLAIMRVGAIYVPVNPSHPPASINQIIEDASPKLIICDTFSQSVAQRFSNTKQWNLGRFNASFTARELTEVKSLPRGRTAYIIYTSGSTGRPKGVRIAHKTLCAFLLAIQNEIQCESSDRFAAITTICFDIAGLEMYLPLTLGAAVVLVPPEAGFDGAVLKRFLEEHKVSVFQATPATYRLLMAGGWNKTPSLTKILCGGEALPEKLALQLLSVADDVWNVYGPTEATIWSTCKKLSTVTSTPTIGKPIVGTGCYILDEDRHIVPMGEEGELHISGLGLAEGYHCAPEKTRERFFELVTAETDKERVYSTGDKARITPEGDIEYLGRLDFQVKIRGYRVELQEIELVAMTHPLVGVFAAVSYLDGVGENAICGFYKSIGNQALSTNTLKSFLAERLESYKIPSSFIPLAEMPLNSNGKVDRNALPIPQRKTSTVRAESSYVHDFDRQVYKAWCDVLQIQQSGDNDDFFLLGGHSIAAYLLIKKLEGFSGRRVPLGLLFSHSKLGDFLKAVRGQDDNPMATKVLMNKASVNKVTDETVYFICGINLYQNLANSLPKSVRANAIYVELEQRFLLGNHSDNLKGDKLLTNSELAEYYVKTILSDKSDKPIKLCGISYGGMLALEVASQLERQNVEVDSVFMLDSVLPQGHQKTFFYSLFYYLKKLGFSLFEKFFSLILPNPVSLFFKRINHTLNKQTVLQQQEKNLAAAIATVDTKAIKYSGRVVLIKAKGHKAYRGVRFKEDYGWQDALGRTVEIHSVTGDHIGMIDEYNAHNVAEIMQQERSNG